jgi:two-component system KDP operon response regulator KdpE
MTALNIAEDKLILIIEDDPGARHFLKLALTSHGFKVSEAITGKAGLALAAKCQPEMILLDLGLPDVDGVSVTQQLREWTTVPIIVLSGKRQEADKVAALDAGADDYLTKPYGMDELLARIRVAIRHIDRAQQGRDEPVFVSDTLRVDLARRQVFVAGVEVILTPTEYDLLATLVRYSGKVLTHQQLLKEVWGPEYVRERNYVRIYIKHLREKLEADPTQPRYILSEPGVGYRLVVY